MKRIMEKIFGTHWKAFLIVGVIVIASIVLVNLCPWCRSATVEWMTYDNPVYGYSVEYPAHWVLDKIRPTLVQIYNEDTSAEQPILVNIVVNDWPLPLEAKVDEFISAYIYDAGHDSVHILTNSESDDRWDWKIAYRFVEVSVPCYGEAYFLHTENCTFTIHLQSFGSVGSSFDLCQDIADSFQLTT